MKIRIHSLPVAALAALCLFQPCLTHGQTTVTNGLIAHLKFENNYTDEIGNITTAGPAGAPTFETGLIGKAIHMVTTKDGATNDYVTLGYPGVLVFGSDATSDTTDFSFSFWVKVNHQADDQAFISNKDWNSGGNKGWIIASEGDGMKWNLRDDGGSGRRDSPHVAPAVVDGRWHHIAVTFQRTNNAKIYVDGALINTTSMAPDAGVPVGSLDTDNLGWSVNLGQDGSGLYTDGGSAEMDFLMDDLGAWRRLLAENEVSEIYNKGLVGKSLEQQAVIPTSISSQPTNQTVLVGFNVDFKVIAVGLNLLAEMQAKERVGHALRRLQAEIAESNAQMLTQHVVDALLYLTRADYALVLMIDDSGSDLASAFDQPAPDQLVAAKRRLVEGIAEWVKHADRTVTVPDISKSAWSRYLTDDTVKAGSVVGVPIPDQKGGSTFGAIVVGFDRARDDLEERPDLRGARGTAEGDEQDAVDGAHRALSSWTMSTSAATCSGGVC